jgi:hypothetical protein
MPSLSGIERRFPTWDEALVAAGLEALGGRRTAKLASNFPYAGTASANDTILEILYQAGVDLDWNLTEGTYGKWRKERMEQDKQELRFRRIPHWHTYKKRCGCGEERGSQGPARRGTRPSRSVPGLPHLLGTSGDEYRSRPTRPGRSSPARLIRASACA